MKKIQRRTFLRCLAVVGSAAALAACSSASSAPAASAASVAEAPAATPEPAAAPALPDGVYTAIFETDSSMFHVNETLHDRGTLTVQDGKMTIHVSLASSGIQQLFVGVSEDAQKPGAALLDYTVDKVTYPDGITEEVHGFDIPVPVLEEDFDLALIGTKGKWYDHLVRVRDVQPLAAEPTLLDLPDGSYRCDVTLTGGTGRAAVESPALLTVADGVVSVRLVWSSPNYDYMLVEGEKYLPVNTEGNSVFDIPVAGFDADLPIVADTVAMSQPHEVEYTLRFDSSTLEEAAE